MHKKYCDNEKLSPLVRVQTVKKPRRAREGRSPFDRAVPGSTCCRFSIRKAVQIYNVGTGRFLRRKIPFSREKSVSLQAPRSKNLRFLAETGEGWQWRGSLLPRPPACQFFYKLKPPAPPVDDCCVSKPSRAVETGSGKRAAGRPPPNKSPHEAVRRRFALPRAFEGLNHGKAQSGRLWPCRAADRRL